MSQESASSWRLCAGSALAGGRRAASAVDLDNQLLSHGNSFWITQKHVETVTICVLASDILRFRHPTHGNFDRRRLALLSFDAVLRESDRGSLQSCDFAHHTNELVCLQRAEFIVGFGADNARKSLEELLRLQPMAI